MSAAKTAIINKALTYAGAAPVTSIDDETNNARVVRGVYELSLRSVLSECKWNFATRRRLLSVSADTLDWYDVGEGIVYVRPSEVVRIFGTNSQGASWREEGDYIISDTSGLGIRYTYFLDDPTKYSAQFIDALVDKLTSDIAYMIVNSGTLGEKYLMKYQKSSLPNATAANSQAGIQQVLVDDAWESAKWFNGQPNA